MGDCLSSITLEKAQEHLNAWLEAEIAVTQGQSYQIGSRRLERANLYQIREQIKYWRKTIRQLSGGSKSHRRVVRVIPRDM